MKGIKKEQENRGCHLIVALVRLLNRTRPVLMETSERIYKKTLKARTMSQE